MLMPKYTMGDADVAAVIGFMRSNNPLFAADATVAPALKLSASARHSVVSGETRIPSTPAQGVPVPEKAATVAYGRYLAHAVYDCAGCHTAGWGADKTEGPSSSQAASNSAIRGNAVQSRNLTPDATGIAHYQSKDLARALHQGVRPDGTVISVRCRSSAASRMSEMEHARTAPSNPFPLDMRRERRARLVRPWRRPLLRAVSGGSVPRALGCVSCHGRGAAHEGALVRATGKPAPGRRELDPEPGTSDPGGHRCRPTPS